TDTFAATRLDAASVGGAVVEIGGLNPTAMSISPPPSPPRSLGSVGDKASGCPFHAGLFTLPFASKVGVAAVRNGSYVALFGFKSNRHTSLPPASPRMPPT